ncbi:glycoside hydrolase family 88/105 protein [Consotaella aegiceratis]|uniref:glycoside hydrolase family 88/105 protein n=1 Tax=Consotaella aegiceratis TaxID=3097961 RepID=UPI002F408EBD
MLMDYFDAYARRYDPYKNGAWCYEDGCVYRGLRLLHEATSEARWYDHLKRLVDLQVSPDGTIAGYRVDEYNIDNILSGRALIYLHEVTGEARYMQAAKLLGEQLAKHPRTKAGGYWHKKTYPWQVWLDGLYMGLPFQIELGQATAEEALIEDALDQLSRALDLTDGGDGLYVHGHDESREQRWADSETGRSPAYWGRALGWLSMALVDVIDLVGLQRASVAGIAERTKALLARIIELQTPTGLWLQVIDQPDLPGNYEESSASAMFAYALQKAGRLGLPVDGAVGRQALNRLVATRLVEGPAGVRFEGICQVAGLGGFSGRYRDGTPDYYLTEPVVADDAKGVGPLMMAAAEAVSVSYGGSKKPVRASVG